MSDDSAILRRVRALLALAKSPNPHEAEAAAAKAQELALKYKLDLADLPESEAEAREDANPVGAERVEAPAEEWRRQLAAVVARACLCAAVFEVGGWLHVVGRKEDVAVALELFGYLSRELAAAAERERKRSRAALKGSFLSTVAKELRKLGIGKGVDAKARRAQWVADFCRSATAEIEARLEANRRAFVEGDARQGELVRKADLEVGEAVAQLFPGAKARAASSSLPDLLAALAGRRFGRSVELGGPRGGEKGCIEGGGES